MGMGRLELAMIQEGWQKHVCIPVLREDRLTSVGQSE